MHCNAKASAEITQLIPAVYGGLTEQNPWQELLKSLRVQSQSEVAAITLRKGDTHRSPLILWDRRSVLSDKQIRQARMDHARLIASDPLNAALSNSGDIYTLDEVIDRSRLESSDFYQQLMVPYGIGYQIGMCFEDPRGWRCSIGLMRLAGERPFGDREKTLLRSLLPHLEKALAIYRELHHSQIERDILDQSLCRLGLGVVMLNQQRQVVDCNHAAERMMGKGRPLQVVNGRLVVSQNRDAVEGAIRLALQASEQACRIPFVQALRVAGQGQESLGLLVRSIHARTHWYQGDMAPSAVIYLSRTGQDNIAPEATIEGLFGLTHTEAVVALLLCNGFTLAQISTKLEVAENTARAYSKRIFAKMGVTRQVELVRVLLRSVAFLA